MACSNQWDGARYGGGCLVAGPDGALTAECWRDEPAVLAFDVDEVELQRYHASDADIRHRYFPGCAEPSCIERIQPRVTHLNAMELNMPALSPRLGAAQTKAATRRPCSWRSTRVNHDIEIQRTGNSGISAVS